jgi:CBS domain-containing protein
MSILHMCDEVPATVTTDATVAQAIKTMLDMRVGAVAVVDAENCVAGIFTERDVLKKLALSGRDPAKTPVIELMTTPVDMATSEMTPGEALETMVDHHFRHLPIVDSKGRLLGILSIRNLLQAQVDELRQQLDSLEQYVSNDGPGG